MTGKQISALLLLGAGFVLGANPLQLPEYDRTALTGTAR